MQSVDSMTTSATRRGFITGLGALFLCAPAIVKASSLMPVSNKVFIKDYMVLYGWDADGNEIEEWTEAGLPIPSLDVRPQWAEVRGFGPARAAAPSHWVRKTGLLRAPRDIRLAGWPLKPDQYDSDP